MAAEKANGITCIICVCDEEEILRDCLNSVRWVDETIIIDCGASEKAREIYKPYASRVLNWPRPAYADLIRTQAQEEAANPWILWMDPDERVPEKLATVLRNVAESGSADCVRIPFTVSMFGHVITHSGHLDEAHERFYRKGAIEWPSEVHSVARIVGRLYNLERREGLCIIHIGCTSVEQYIEKMNRYTTGEVSKKTKSVYSYPSKWVPQYEFIRRFYDLEGFKDGYAGFHLCNLMSVYATAVHAKKWVASENDSGMDSEEPTSVAVQATHEWVVVFIYFLRTYQRAAAKNPQWFKSSLRAALCSCVFWFLSLCVRIARWVLVRCMKNPSIKSSARADSDKGLLAAHNSIS